MGVFIPSRQSTERAYLYTQDPTGEEEATTCAERNRKRQSERIEIIRVN